MIAIDLIKAYGHPNVRGTHKTTLEITKDDYLTPRGDCIIGIKANKGAFDLSSEVKLMIKSNSYVYVVIKVDNLFDIIHGYGDEKLSLIDENKIILRKSTYISDATIMIKADKSARDIKREILDKMRNEKTELNAFIIASDKSLKDSEILRIVINRYPSIST
ncbi:DUF371 domain-containing protein [Sulfurisphaera javensis]|uniref:DUF371 domain-containing protein n=1 Tax=Sulfurisphaera javensis TaxID=2049879 RepID=A0AAT9GPF9_9CREN